MKGRKANPYLFALFSAAVLLWFLKFVRNFGSSLPWLDQQFAILNSVAFFAMLAHQEWRRS